MGTQLNMSYTREHSFGRTQAKPVNKPRPRASQGHFDPDELTRRLYVVLADQKAHSQRKRMRQEEMMLREARLWAGQNHGSKERSHRCGDAVPERSSSKTQQSSGKPSDDQPLSLGSRRERPISLESSTSGETTTYRHVPREAAIQFARTTTVNGMKGPTSPTFPNHGYNNNNNGTNIVHKISKQALKYHLSGRGPNGTSQEQARRDRPRIPEEIEERTFHSELLKMAAPPPPTLTPIGITNLRADHNRQEPGRRNSTGDVALLLRAPAATDEQPRRSLVVLDSLAEVLAATATADDAASTGSPSSAHGYGSEPLSPHEINEHRVDWSQSDEMALKLRQQRRQRQSVLSPLLRKADSIWLLKGRLGGGGGGVECEKVRGESPGTKSPKSPGSGGFFAKFKK